MKSIKISNAYQNNLKHLSLDIPNNQLIVVTGVSGSGKSSLVFDVINREGQNQFFINMSAQARKYLGKLKKPNVDSITGLYPCISIAQNNGISNPKSTVGTLTDIYNNLRLLFARLGESSYESLAVNNPVNRSLFSFNSKHGACENCQGIGLEDKISVNLLIEDPDKTIREGCFKITNPDGYIIYSQVRMEELEKVCKANGFSVDIPWKDLSLQQQDIVLNGSNAIKILYGKHSLESRMKWTGIKANPREEEFYKGILPVMNQILKKDRNPNILRFAETQTCSVCIGSRLKQEALDILILNKNIAYYSTLNLEDLIQALKAEFFPKNQQKVAKHIIQNIQSKISYLKQLGLEYLSLNRASNTLSPGEIQSIRLASQLNSKLRNITYIFDEPSIGLHPNKNKNVIQILKQLVQQGNTVIVVEHDAETIKNADWIIEIGPKAGQEGGELLFNGSQKDFFNSNYQSSTKSFLNGSLNISYQKSLTVKPEYFSIQNASINNLKNISPKFQKQALNIVTGLSGAGKSSLIHHTLVPLIKGNYIQEREAKNPVQLSNFDFEKTLLVDQSPIGKTARSTPATYTKLFDLIRDFYSRLPKAKTLKLNKSSFSFNSKHGQCKHCEGAGKIELGMHFLGNVESTCPVCKGERYLDNILDLRYHSKNISDVLKMTVEEALEFFKEQDKIKHYLEVIKQIGLAYIQLGQSSNSLSGGEAQRIRLASELVKKQGKNQLFIFDEPSTGLHFSDLQNLIKVFEKLIEKGHTILLIEHNEDLIKNADRIIDIGPGSAQKGGKLVFEGAYSDLLQCEKSVTGQSLLQLEKTEALVKSSSKKSDFIELLGVETNNLKNIDIKIPYHKHTVIVGKSGSGKSSLAFDTLYAESQNSYIESFPSYIQQFARQQSASKLKLAKGLNPSIALKQNLSIKDPRSTVGTLTGISEYLRLLMSRFGQSTCSHCKQEIKNNYCSACRLEFVDTSIASNYSFNLAEGACNTCKGLGEVLSSSPALLIEDYKLNFVEGALKNYPLFKSYTDVHEKYMATLLEVGRINQIDFNLPIEQLNPKALQIAFYGTADEIYDVKWHYKTKTDQGVHSFEGKWMGFVGLLLEEYYRRYANGKGSELLAYLENTTCSSCQGDRLKPEILAVKYNHKNIAELSKMSLSDLSKFISISPKAKQTQQIIDQVKLQLEPLLHFNLDYINLNRNSSSLSSGELQRVLLSSHLKGSLTGICYILDEPCSGLHPADISKVQQMIKALVTKGNTVVSVEHQKDFIASTDHLIELGPGSGKDGGELLYSGQTSEYNTSVSENDTANDIDQIKFTDGLQKDRKISIRKANIYNTKDLSVSFLKDAFNVITGVSGSGKTTLMRDVLLKSHKNPINCESVEGLLDFSEILWIDRKGIVQTKISSLASYFGLMDDIKKCFAPILKGHTIKTAHLSYNNKMGQCPDCKGLGYTTTKMDFLNDVISPCETCKGQRYQPEILALKWKHFNMAELLDLSIAEAQNVFLEETIIKNKLDLLEQLGLSYLKLGQSSHNFSGGEAQRIKIAKLLLEKNSLPKLFIFDEASRGLHQSDLKHLLQTFKSLLTKGHTIIAIEHQIDIIKKAQWLVDIHEGRLIYQGGLKGLKIVKNSLTANYI